ncbi:MAG: metal-dependent hydrolase [Bacteroidales bacterium]|nr:metal-dependent hydrolase [Bacteroidales bacterium]
MNIISQFVLCAAIGSLIGAKKMGNKSILLGGLCSLVPSLDYFIAYFFETTTSLYVWGGITHSIVFCILMAPILGWGIRKYVGKKFSAVFCSFFAFSCLMMHCLSDVLSIQGVGLLEPFSSRRFSLSILSNIDWLSLVPLVIAFVAALIVKDLRHKAMISWFGTFLFVVYVAFAFLNKLSVQSLYEQKLEEQSLRYSRTEVFPVAGAMFLWNCVAQDRDGFWVSYQSNLSRNDFEMELVLRNDYYMFEHEGNLLIDRLEAYTKQYYAVEPMAENVVVLHDLRFGKRGFHSKEYNKSYTIDYSDRENIRISKR